MATNFPTSLDTLTNPTSTDSMSTVSHSSQHINANDAIEALEAKVGADSSAVTTSHDYKLSSVTSTAKAVSTAGDQTVAGNKTFSGDNTFSGTNTFGSGDLRATKPQITTSIDDANGNELIESSATASAVNHLKVTNAATGNDIELSPAGDDTDAGIKIKGKGSDKVKLGDAELQWPDADGSSGQRLTTNGSGVLSWADAGGVEGEATTGATHSLTTDGSTKVIVFAMGQVALTGGSSGDFDVDVILKYDGVAKHTVTQSVAAPGAAGNKSNFSLMYTETPAADTADITVETANAGGSNNATLSNVKIQVLKL